MKKKSKTKDLVLDYTSRPLLHSEAMEFQFKSTILIAVNVPTVGMVVMGKDSPSRCWSYPQGTSFKDAVSKTLRTILEDACKHWKEKKKA